jgi:Ankyrin repeats (many copies)
MSTDSAMTKLTRRSNNIHNHVEIDNDEKDSSTSCIIMNQGESDDTNSNSNGDGDGEWFIGLYDDDENDDNGTTDHHDDDDDNLQEYKDGKKIIEDVINVENNFNQLEANENENDKLTISQLRIGLLLKTNAMISKEATMMSTKDESDNDQDVNDIIGAVIPTLQTQTDGDNQSHDSKEKNAISLQEHYNSSIPRRASSYYFSVCSSSLSLDKQCSTGSISDLLSFYDSESPTAQQQQQQQQQHLEYSKSDDTENSASEQAHYNMVTTTSTQQTSTTTSEIGTETKTSLHHDLLVNILQFLDLDSLASFSEAGRRPNGESYYFIRMQLQHILHLAKTSTSQIMLPLNPASTTTTFLSSLDCNDIIMKSLPDLHFIYRLAMMDYNRAESIIRELYYELPLQHSTHRKNYNTKAAKMAAGSAVLVACMGMAAAYGAHNHTSFSTGLSSFATTTTTTATNPTTMEEWDEYAAAITAFMKLVGVFGSIAAAKTMAAVSTATNTSTTASKDRKKDDSRQKINHHSTPAHTFLIDQFPLLVNESYRYPDPYEHLPKSEQQQSADRCTCTDSKVTSRTNSRSVDSNSFDQMGSSNNERTPSKQQSSSVMGVNGMNTIEKNTTETSFFSTDQFYVGSIGAYKRIVRAAKREIVSIVRQQRRNHYHSIVDDDEKRNLVNRFMAAVIANDLPLVQQYIHRIDIDESYPIQAARGGEDNDTAAQMYPVHAAAFYGADQVLDYLCQSIDSNPKLQSPGKRKKSRFSSSNNVDPLICIDGGLANINQQDMTGWTVLHFAAGSNNTAAVRMLLYKYNADPNIEADNGYTPFQWARRLQHNDVMTEFQSYFNQKHHDTFSKLLRRHFF